MYLNLNNSNSKSTIGVNQNWLQAVEPILTDFKVWAQFWLTLVDSGAEKNILIVRNLHHIKKKYAWEQFITVLQPLSIFSFLSKWWYCVSRFVTSWIKKFFPAPYFPFSLIFPFSAPVFSFFPIILFFFFCCNAAHTLEYISIRYIQFRQIENS